MSADNPILRNLPGLPGSAARSNRGQPDRLTNPITQKYAAAPLRDAVGGQVGPSQIIDQVTAVITSFTGTGALSVGQPALAGAGALKFVGAGAFSVPQPSIAGTGKLKFVATGVLTARSTVAGSGSVSGVVVVAVGGRPRHPGRRKRKRVEAEVEALAAQIAADLTPAPTPWEADDEAVLDLLLMGLLE